MSTDDRLDRRLEPSPETESPAATPAVSRRGFLGGLGGAAAALASGVAGVAGLAAPASAAPAVDLDDFRGTPSAGEVRRQAAFTFRQNTATYWKGQAVKLHPTNGDEGRFPSRIGNYSKALPHNGFGEVDPAAYQSLLTATGSGKPADFDDIIMGGPTKLTNPQAGMAFDLEGADAFALTVPPPPSITSGEMASEGVENYWAAPVTTRNSMASPSPSSTVRR